MKVLLKALKYMGISVLVLILAIGAVLLYLWLRPNTAFINPELQMETWDAVKDGMHNSNTHMIFWKNEFWLVHANSPYHFATPQCKLMVWHSPDARQWQKATEVRVPGEDIRDPKFAVIKGKLILYVLKSIRFEAEPYRTAYTFTTDGTTWAPLKDIMDQDGWLFWNPKSTDGTTWYVPVYWYEHGQSALLTSADGERWTFVSIIHNGRNEQTGFNDRNDETDIEFLPDRRMISTQRMEGSDSFFGDKTACTNLTISSPPYTSWTELGKDYTTRLDGPALFSYHGRVYAVGRSNPYKPGPGNYYGSIFAKKRTSLFLVTQKGLVYLSDLPSAGDTAYEGVVMRGEDVYISYYTSDVTKDWPWLMGMVKASEIRIAKISLPSLENLALKTLADYDRHNKYQFFPATH